MNLQNKIRSIILSHLVESEARTVGMEEECILYTKDNRRLPVNPCAEFSATDLLSIMNENVGFIPWNQAGNWNGPVHPIEI